MKGFFSIIGLGIGLSFGGGLIYLFVVNETAWIIFLALGMFVLGAVTMAAAMLILNRQWMWGVFGKGQPGHVSNHYRLQTSPYPTNTPAPMAPQYDPYAGYGFQVIENQTASGALTDDSPMA